MPNNCNMPQTRANIDNMPIGMAYVPWQNFNNIYPVDKALIRGTIFAELDKPFLRGCGM